MIGNETTIAARKSQAKPSQHKAIRSEDLKQASMGSILWLWMERHRRPGGLLCFALCLQRLSEATNQPIWAQAQMPPETNAGTTSGTWTSMGKAIGPRKALAWKFTGNGRWLVDSR